MSALADALVAAQSRAVAALGKQYVAGKIDGETMRGRLCAIGLTDEVDADRLTWALDTIREYGAALPSEPATSNGKASDEAATDAQWTLVRKLAGEKKQPVSSVRTAFRGCSGRHDERALLAVPAAFLRVSKEAL